MLTQENVQEAKKKALFGNHIKKTIAKAVEVEAEKGTDEGMRVLDEAIAFESKYRHLL